MPGPIRVGGKGAIKPAAVGAEFHQHAVNLEHEQEVLGLAPVA
jgi:hypothetical protein